MWRQLGDSEPSGIFLHDVPNYLFSDLRTPNRPFSADAPEQLALSNVCCTQPIIQRLFHPIRHRHSSNMGTLPDKVHNGPVILSPLKVVKRQSNQLTATQSTTQQYSQDGAIPLALESVRIGELPERTPFLCREPIPKPHSQLFCSFHTSDAGGKLRAQEPRVGGFIR